VRRPPLAFLAFVALLGCRGAALQQGPSDTLRSYSRALDDGRADDAYKLLSSEAKRSISLDAFRRMVKENAPEMKDIAHSLSRPSSDPVVTATVTSPKGDTVLLVYEEGRWRLDGSAINLYGQATPRQSIEAFLRAFERKRYDVMLRFVPDSHLEGLDASKLRAAWEGAQKEEMSASRRPCAPLFPPPSSKRSATAPRWPTGPAARFSSFASTGRGRSRTSTEHRRLLTAHGADSRELFPGRFVSLHRGNLGDVDRNLSACRFQPTPGRNRRGDHRRVPRR
jgi:hypothetical protein